MCITWDEPTAPFKQASGLYRHSPFRHMHAAIQNAKLQRAPKYGQNTVIETPLDSARRRIRAKTSQLTCEQGSPYDPAGVRHVPSHSDIAPRASWIVACQACRLSGFSGATQTPTSAVSRVHTVIVTAKRPRKLHSGIAMRICRDQAVAYSRTKTGALTFHETMSANYTTAKAFRPRILKKKKEKKKNSNRAT